MVMVTAHFERVAEEVTERTAELLGAPVAVTDERGMVIASSERHTVGLPGIWSTPGRSPLASAFRSVWMRRPAR